MNQNQGAAQNIELHIEELVLHGFSPRERYAIGEAVQRELTRLFTEQGVPPSLLHPRAAARLDLEPLRGDMTAKPDVLGRAVARALYRELSR